METTTQSENSSKLVYTAGTIFKDGSTLTLLSNNRLVFTSQEGDTIATSISRGEKTFAPVPLDAGLAKMLRLPQEKGEFRSATVLAYELRDVFVSMAGLSEVDALLVAMFVLATWTSIGLLHCPLLNMWGSIEDRITTQNMLERICRHPLAINEPTISEIANLPARLDPSFILQEPSHRLLRRLLARTPELRHGRILSVQCSVAAFTTHAVEYPGLKIHLSSTHQVRPSLAALEALVERFQPRLLGFRLARWSMVASSDFDVPDFTGAVRALAQVYGAVAAGEPELQEAVVSALKTRDEAIKADLSQSIETAVLESVLSVVHEGKTSVRIREIAELTNALLADRDERETLTAKTAGLLIRSFGFEPVRDRQGYQVVLDPAGIELAHKRAAERQARSMMNPTINCELCKKLALPGRGPSVDGSETKN